MMRLFGVAAMLGVMVGLCAAASGIPAGTISLASEDSLVWCDSAAFAHSSINLPDGAVQYIQVSCQQQGVAVFSYSTTRDISSPIQLAQQRSHFCNSSPKVDPEASGQCLAHLMMRADGEISMLATVSFEVGANPAAPQTCASAWFNKETECFL